MNESSQLFTELQPPAGGLQRLQRTIRRPATDSKRTGWWLAAGALALLLLASLLPGRLTQQRRTTELVSAMLAAMAPPAQGIEVTDGAALELPSGQTNVRLYLVQSIDPSTMPAGAGRDARPDMTRPFHAPTN